MNIPLISVILPTYNGSRFLNASISSVLNQSYRNLELIIINDASTDSQVEEIVLRWEVSDNRIIYVKNKTNLERSASKNKGVTMARGEYVAFIDDDDTWNDSEKLTKQMDILSQHTEIGIIGTYAICVDEEYQKIGSISTHESDEDIRKNLLITNQFIQSSILMRKEIFVKSGGFNEAMNLCEDYDLWLRIGRLTRMYNITEYCTDYMIRKSNTTSKNSLKMKKLSFSLAFKYRKEYPRFFTMLIVRGLTFFMPIKIIVAIKYLLSHLSKKTKTH